MRRQLGIDWAADYSSAPVCLICASSCEVEVSEQERDLPDAFCMSCGHSELKWYETDGTFILLSFEDDDDV